MSFEWRGGDVHFTKAASELNAHARPPGSKSLTNRFLFMAALADGASTLAGAATADDSARMAENLRQLGIAIDAEPPDLLRVSGCGGVIPEHEAELDVRGAGTVMRFLTAFCCLAQGQFRIDGSERMRERPIGALVNGLRELGAQIDYDGQAGFPPLRIAAAGLPGGHAVFSRAISSQFASALLLAAPLARQDVLLELRGGVPSRPYLDMTIAAMRAAGVELLGDGSGRLVVPAWQSYRAGHYEIEPDASAATYFWGAAALCGGRVQVDGLSDASLQGDVRFVDVLAEMGCCVERGAGQLAISRRGGALRGVDVDLNDMPDTAQTLAVLSLFAEGPTRIRNVGNLRVKETDRLAALACELTKLGAAVELEPDGITIRPPAQPSPARIETYDDHRMAMSFSLAGLRIPGLTIADANCVRKSVPGFFDRLAALERSR